MTKHSNVVGGSTAGLALKCNASIIQSRGVPNDDNVWSRTGTACHKIMELCGPWNSPIEDVTGHFLGVEIEGIKITRELLTSKVLPALDWLDNTFHPDVFDMQFEQKVGFGEDLPGAFGTADVTFTSKATHNISRCGIVDYKFGDYTIISAEDNDQGRFYLLASILSGLLPEDPMVSYEFHIFQPSVLLPREQWHTVGYYTLDDLLRFGEELYDAVHGEPVYVVGPHCAKCKGNLTCEAFKQSLAKVIDLECDTEGMTGAQLAHWRDMVPALESFCKNVRSAAYRNAVRGVRLPGWKLEPSLGDRVWKNEQAAVNALGRLGVDIDTRIIRKPISAPQALEHLKTIGTPQLAIEKFERRHVHRPDNGERLVKVKPGEEGDSLSELSNALKKGYSK